jgi:ATP synthase protein I
MTEPRTPPRHGADDTSTPPPFVRAVDATVGRKLRSQRKPGAAVMSGLGLMGLVGWSVVMPTLLGAALGLWIDRTSSGTRSWTLALLVAGLCLGCLNAWHWIARESRAIVAEQDDDAPEDRDA